VCVCVWREGVGREKEIKVEGLNRERLTSPKEEGSLPAGCLWT